VAILGGGIAGLTVAFELSRGTWRDRFDSITVYQYGWRLGGKGASGRGGHGRIEEHGFHIWFGFYQNAFQIMRDCYNELNRAPGVPLQRVSDAFEPHSFFTVQEERGGEWIPWSASFPEYGTFPGDPGKGLPSLWTYIVRALDLSRQNLATVLREHDADDRLPGGGGAPAGIPPPGSLTFFPVPPSLLTTPKLVLKQLWDSLSGVVKPTVGAVLAAALSFGTRLGDDVRLHSPSQHNHLLDLVTAATSLARERRPSSERLSDTARRQWYVADILLTLVRGVLEEGLLTHPAGLDAIDCHDFVDWLILHGAEPESARCALIKTVAYDLQFAYRFGDPAQPSCSAATALRGLIRLFLGYEGAIAWKMRAGMGDAVFAPLWQVLVNRGVQFEFFHRVEALHLSGDGQRISVIDVSRQVSLRKPNTGYQPLVLVRDLPCWPNHPRYEQLLDADGLRPEDVESFWSERAPAEHLELRDGKEFDKVVLAIPVGAHPYICQELIEHSRAWADMVNGIGTIYTQVFQLWLSATMEELGCDSPPATTGGYLEPFDTYADMRQLIDREKWPHGKVRGIAYFCNAMPTPEGVPSREERTIPAQAHADVKARALAFLRDEMPPLWPRGVKRYPTNFRWELLVGGDDSVTGQERFNAQFWRANVDPSERYVLPLPGTAQYRLPPDGSGFENLYLAGDWTKCGLNAGCVEAAVISGRVAAHAIGGSPPLDEIVGYREF
jgi:uncharacterized protein with NAD-binding domain and iron-sulfur cluster